MPITKTAADTAKLVHATLELHEPGKELGSVGPLLKTLAFQMNPKELTLAKTAKWETKSQNKSSSAPPSVYLGPEPAKMTVEMFFDATRAHDNAVVENVEALFTACTPTKKSKNDKPSAPWVLFKWGSLTGFVGYIKSVSAKYTMFAPSGQPLRAICTVALEELALEPGKQNPTSGGLQPRRVHTLSEGDTLPAIAFREYGSAALWRAVADVNGIDDPMRLRPGSPVFLPTAEELVGSRDATRTELARAIR
ncbi:CIS tube protein [Leifsonia sp. Leaf264]|uniref:CIS tube protein n=1 Tax=Leifsonia sp. Leaf264 TaxID=1736314 RepID=UPI0006F2BF38|nr:LysM peptidoglycan-binding domain-containing protein [Leifsonia sp. Leaf264]KQO96749.1 peptidase M23 [Leifsonia sp. Leaf264]